MTTLAGIRNMEQLHDALSNATQQVERLRRNHDGLLTLVRWCVEHPGECLADNPNILVLARKAMAEAGKAL